MPHKQARGALARVGVLLGAFLAIVALAPAQLGVAAAPAGVRDHETFLKQDIDALLDRRYERIPPFVDWTYGWATSYANSYIAAARIIAALWHAQGGWVETARSALREHELRILRDRVTQPDGDAADFANLIERHIQARMFADGAELRATLCQANSQGPCSAPLAAKMEDAAASVQETFRSPEAMAREHAELVQLLDVRNEPGVDFLHALRPLTSRILIFILRFAEITSVVMLVTAALRQIYVPNTAITRILATVGIAWGLDYSVLQAERAFNQEAFAQRIADQLTAQRAEISSYVGSRIAAAETAYMRELSAAAGGP